MKTPSNWTDVAGGVLVFVVCSAFFALSFQYEMGSLSRMRPGLFPAILGAIGVLVGVAMIVNGLRAGAEDAETHSFSPRALICTLVAIAGFALLIRPTGLLPAVVVSTGVSALGDPKNKILTVLILAFAAALLVWTIFVLALGLPMPLIKGVA